MTRRRPTPTRAELEARIATLEAQRDQAHAAELQAFRAKFGLRDLTGSAATVPPRPPMTEEHAQRRAAFRAKFGMRDMTKPVETHEQDGATKSKADARAAFKAKFGLS